MPTDDEVYGQGQSPEDLIAEMTGGAAFYSQENDLEAAPQQTPQAEELDDGLIFDENYKQDFQSLLTLGKLSARFNYAGHLIGIRTLRSDELLELGPLHEQYMNTITDVRAFATLTAAACWETIDGMPLPVPLPLGPGESDLEAKFNYIRKNYYPPTITAIYDKYRALEMRVENIINEMGKA